MNLKQPPIIIIILIAVAAVAFIFLNVKSFDLPEGESVPLREIIQKENQSEEDELPDVGPRIIEPRTNTQNEDVSDKAPEASSSSREILVTDGVKHSIPIEDIKQGCFGRDCIRSVDDPVFISKKEADNILPEGSIGIGLIFNNETRFYPFNMLVTREIVNDEIDGQPVAVTYCPLCGTGIVFNRKVENKVYEFGVSGMLWQSNLLMYNRESYEDEISLWSQVLGEAVLGVDTGLKLAIIPSDVVKYEDWSKSNPKTKVLNTGRIGDPYNGDYYGVAQHFEPDFDEASSPLQPTAYVFGIQIDGQFKAYENSALEIGTTKDTFAEKELIIEKEEDGVVRIYEDGISTPLQIVTGFWFSWVAAHPDTELFK